MSDTTGEAGGFAILEDPTGRRARWLRRGGRIVFLVFLVWLLAIVLGGLGLIPVAGIPLVHVLRPSQGPPVLTKLPTPRQPSPADLRPAVRAEVFAAKTATTVDRASPAGKTARAGSPRGKSAAPGQIKRASTTTVAQGKSTAPGQIKKASTTPAGHGKNTAPGQAKKTTTPDRKPKKP